MTDHLWSLSETMDLLVELENTVHADLTVVRWRPRANIELPALYNWFDPSEAEFKDQAKRRDTLRLVAIVAVEHSDDDEEMAKVEVYADAFRQTIDAAFNERGGPLSGARRAERNNMQLLVDDFAGVNALCIGFELEIWLDRIYPHP